MNAGRRVRAAAVLLLALAGLAPWVRAQTPAVRPPVQGAPAEVTAFVNVNVVPMDSERVLANQTVLVDGGWITALGPSRQVKLPAGATQIDGPGMYLMPGLADMHTHLVYNAGDSAAIERRLFSYLAHGITTVRNMDYGNRQHGEAALRLRARAAAGELLSPRIYTSGGMTWGEGRRMAPPESIAVYVAAYQAAGYDFVKIYQEQGAVRDSLLTIARRLGIPVSGHARELGPTSLEESFTALAEGYASIEHLSAYLGFKTPIPPDRSQIRALAAATRRAGVWNDPTLVVHASFGHFFKDVPVSLQMVKALQDVGAGLLLGSDAAGMMTPFLQPGAATHMELQALVMAGLTPYQALATGTRNVAAFFGTLGEAGTVAVGKRADLVLLRGNPLAAIRSTLQSTGVMIGGRWLARAELDRRLAALTPSSESEKRKNFTWQHVEPPLRPGPLDWNDLYWAYVVETIGETASGIFAELTLTDTQRTALREFKATHKAPRQALVDSLAAGVPNTTAGHQRVLRLVTRQLEEARAVLTPEQQTVFATQVRAWRCRVDQWGYSVATPGCK